MTTQVFEKNWTPDDRATLCFITHNSNILLIRKKRGLGAGKINAPGGRIEPGESAEQATIRECLEELHISPVNPQLRGELFFHFTSGYRLHCGVFLANQFSGTPAETPEATPLWTPISQIPFDQMWQDDRIWLPPLLEGKTFRAWFVFEHESMLDHKIEWNPPFLTIF
ncbi:MAG: 8-oxo-dGTP diphosphatase [Chthoniobacterales bacterium]|nr:8-oxo-dGTP diphosphatase [Chthoniobacterales bacterium]